MKVELHLHTSRHSGCAIATPAELMVKLVAAGYDAVYITEHDTVWPEWEIAQLQQEFPQIRIFAGVELSVGRPDTPLQHLLVLGTSDSWYLSVRDIPAILERARAEGHLTILAHPTRWEGAATIVEQGLLPDALEYRTANLSPEEAAGAEALAGRVGLPLLNAGDVHGPDFVDRFWIETARPVERAGDIRSIVLDGAYENRSNEE
jgi:predicted metal-dependent phosphoesterase TrpH